MKKILLLILIVTTGNCIAQSPIADSLRDVGKLKEAIENYASFYAENPDNRDNTYNYACALGLNKQIDSSFKYLFIATENDSMAGPLNDPDFYFLLEDDRWSDFEKGMIPKIEAKYKPNYSNLELTKELWRMKIKDQAFYYHIKLADNLNGKDTPLLRGLWELKHLINDENLKRLEEILAEHGWPKKSEVGGSASGTAFLIVQHADLKTQKKYLPMLKAAVKDKEASGGSLALLVDRINIREGGKQLYGSQIGRKEDGSYYVLDLQEPEYVNQRRAEVGLGPLEDYAKRWDIEWTVEQKEK